MFVLYSEDPMQGGVAVKPGTPAVLTEVLYGFPQDGTSVRPRQLPSHFHYTPVILPFDVNLYGPDHKKRFRPRSLS
jgi:hypothetical protein